MNSDKPENNRSLKDFLTNPIVKTDNKALQYSGLGIQLSGTILIFVLIGIWLDKKFETNFIFTLILAFVGFAGGFYSFFLTIQNLTKKEKEAKEKKAKELRDKMNQK
ncbi:MAG TPA: AtpZ/AtpI family protein [Ignavibacteria bacterium]|nr:AtpZ/AtpI family protein [Ignavibacteria bacterium]